MWAKINLFLHLLEKKERKNGDEDDEPSSETLLNVNYIYIVIQSIYVNLNF